MEVIAKTINDFWALKDKENRNLWQRQDDDFEKLVISSYDARNYNNEVIPEAYPVYSSWLYNYDQYVHALLLKSPIVMSVTSDPKRGGLAETKRRVVEEAANDIFRTMEHSVTNRYPFMAGYRSTTYNHICQRGYIITRVIVQDNPDVDGELLVDTPPLDPRYCGWEYGKNGKLAKFAMRFQRSRDETVAIYPQWAENIKKAFDKDVSQTDGQSAETKEVTEYWDDKYQYLVIGGNDNIVGKEENVQGYPPFKVSKSQLGIFSQPKDGATEYGGESLIAPVRGVFDEDNRYKTMLSTMAMEGWRRAIVFVGDELFQYVQQHGGPPPKAGGGNAGAFPVSYAPTDTEIKDYYPREQLTQAAIEWGKSIQAKIDEGTFGTLAQGNVPASSEMSGTALRTIIAQKEKVLVPVTTVLCSHFEGVLDMIFDQIEAKNLKGKIGARGRQSEYSAEDFKGIYSLKVEMLVELPEREQLSLSIAQQNRDLGVSRIDSFKAAGFRDPEGMDSRAAKDDLKALSPSYALYESTKQLIKSEEIDDEGVAILAKELTIAKAELDARAMMAQPVPPEGGTIPETPSSGTSANITSQNIQAPIPSMGD